MKKQTVSRFGFLSAYTFSVFLMAMPPAHAEISPTFSNGKIAFSQQIGTGNNDIITMNADGSSQANITNTTEHEIKPTWSYDGTKIAYIRGSDKIWTMNSDGSSQSQIYDGAGQPIDSIAWSSAGKIAFSQQIGTGNNDIITMNADGSSQANITNTTEHERSPRWSPDGSSITYMRDTDKIWKMDADGSDKSQIYDGAGQPLESIDWSQYGQSIAFSQQIGTGNNDIITMNASDGGNQANVTNTTEHEKSPRWSPFGTKVAYVRDTDKVWTMNNDGSSQSQIYDGAGQPIESMDWQPQVEATCTTAGSNETCTVEEGTTTTREFTVSANETLVVNGTVGNVTVQSGGMLKGNGVVGTLNVNTGGTVSPGESPGCLSSGNLTLTGAYQFEVGGTTVCSEYDQITVTGTVDVTGGTVAVSLLNGFVPRVNDSFTIIENDGSDAVTGTLNGLAEGATLTSGGVTYRISYIGGAGGNDVTLTVTAVSSAVTPKAPDTGFGLLAAHPAVTLSVTSGAALGLYLLSRRMQAAKK